MNLAVVNQNNSESVVLPPRMKDLFAWYDVRDSQIVGGDVEKLYDMSGRGVTLENDAGGAEPSYAVQSGTFNGYRVMNFDQASEAEEYEDSTVDWDYITKFGFTLNTNPEYTVAMVLSEDAAAAGQEFMFRAEGNNAICVLKRFNTSVTVYMQNYDAPTVTTAYDYADVTMTEGDTETFILTVKDITLYQKMSLWFNGSKQTFSGSGREYFTITAGSQDLDGITLGKSWHGSIAEVLIWKGDFSDAEAVEAHNYLSDKWGGAA